jgi:hypothetical protein
MKKMVWLWLLLVVVLAYGQDATELYIPIGKSPGISGKTSVMGRVESFNPAIRTLAVNNDGTEHIARITDTTKIYLDRSKMKKTNLYGSEKDLKVGKWVEVAFEVVGRREARWIKVQFAEVETQ